MWLKVDSLYKNARIALKDKGERSKTEKYSARIEGRGKKTLGRERPLEREKGRKGDYWQKCPLHSAQEPGGGALGSGGCYNNCTLVVFSPQCAPSLFLSLQSHESIIVCLKSSSVFPSSLLYFSLALFIRVLSHMVTVKRAGERECVCVSYWAL